MKILLVAPRTPETFWSFKHALPFVSKRAAFPPLGLLTVAGMLPRGWEMKLVDLNVARLRDQDIREADYVLLSAMIVHRESAERVIERCQRLGTPMIAGGPLFTTGHEEFPQVEHFVLGEAEDLIDTLIEDMERGTVRPVYRAEGFPSLTKTPVPRWDLVDLKSYASMCVQFSRGCPFDCEFCDIIVMNGRVPRTKAPAQIVAELETIRRRGWKGSVFLVDDNFIGNKRKVRELLPHMLRWRRLTRSPMTFLTEASVNLADDADLMEQMVEVGFRQVFLGLETPDVASLEECRKLQNTKGDLVESVQRIQAAGMEVMGGFIVGFDSDTPDIFRRQFEFIQKAGVVTAMVGLLTALPKTRLAERLQREGRLLDNASGNNTEACLNFIPKLDRELLTAGYRRLMKSLYEPKAFYARARTYLAQHRRRGPQGHRGWSDIKALLRSMWVLGVWHRGRRQYWHFLAHTAVRHPRAIASAVTLAIYGHHFRQVAQGL